MGREGSGRGRGTQAHHHPGSGPDARARALSAGSGSLLRWYASLGFRPAEDFIELGMLARLRP